MSYQTKWILLIVLVVVLVGGAYFSSKFYKKSDTPPLPTQVSAEVIRDSLLATSKFQFPPIASQDTINLAQLPEDIQVFIVPTPEEVEIQKITYQDELTGFLINYDVKNISLETLYSGTAKLAASYQWKPVAGSRATSFGFMDLEKKSFQLRVSQFSSNTTKDTINVTIQVLVKK